MDRIDLQIEVPAVEYKALAGLPTGPSSAAVRERVVEARRRQEERFREVPGVIATARWGPPRSGATAAPPGR